MLPRELFRTHPEKIRTMLADRHTEAPLDRLLDVDGEWRNLLARVEELKALRNSGSKEIGRLYREGQREEAEAKKAEMSAIGSEIDGIEDRTRELETELKTLELRFPNMLEESTPLGKDESLNREERRWGEPPSFDFEIQAHWDLGPALGIIDFESAAKIAGARFSVLRGLGAALERALISFMLDVHTQEHGYLEILPPYLVNTQSLTGTGQLPKFEEDLFKIGDGDYFLAPTAEVQLTNLHRDEIIDQEALPLRYCAFTPCFRAEAGSYGKDVRGLIRQHQFHKVELVQLTTPESSRAQHDELTSQAETILQRLELPYRVVTLCSGDVGFSAQKTYDIEVWLPGQNQYREISSCSNFGDFQARRAQIRYRRESGKPGLVHTINGSGLAIGRTLVAILENFQLSDGSVRIPDVLRPYLGGRELIEAPKKR